jgi:hypothetical protein
MYDRALAEKEDPTKDWEEICFEVREGIETDGPNFSLS